LGNLVTPNTIQRLQTALYEKAKREPNYRFYSLYDKIYRPDILGFAYRSARANRGAPGVDGETFADIEARGVDEWLGVLAKELREETYKPGPVRRVLIPKPNGKMRPLGIPNLKDRVIQTAAVLVLGSIFEADLAEEQYAYRSGKKAITAVETVQCLMNRDRYLQIVDTDLSGYFDVIPHDKLIKAVVRRVLDGKVIHLIKMWLKAPVVEQDKSSGTNNKVTQDNNDVGTPQGAVISPLLSNIYMREFIVAWKGTGCEKKYGGKVVNYADDLVICCKRDAKGALEDMKGLMEGLGLMVNEEKTKTCVMPGDEFSFLVF
jgi:group II intron reverse transcriptase/maturase